MTTMLVNYWSLQEQIRHNLVAEQELNRHNVATEGISGRQISLGYAELGEAMRHNKVMEQRVEYQNAADATRSISSVASTLGTFGYFKDNSNNDTNNQGGKGGRYTAESSGGKYLTPNPVPDGSGGTEYLNQNTNATGVGKSADTVKDLAELFPTTDQQLYNRGESFSLFDIVKNAFGLPSTLVGSAIPIF